MLTSDANWINEQVGAVSRLHPHSWNSGAELIKPSDIAVIAAVPECV